MGFSAKSLQIPAGGQAGYQQQYDAFIPENLRDAHNALKNYTKSKSVEENDFYNKDYEKKSLKFQAKHLKTHLENAAIRAQYRLFDDVDAAGYTPEILEKAGYGKAAEKLAARNRALPSENAAVDALLEAQEESSAAAKKSNQKLIRKRRKDAYNNLRKIDGFENLSNKEIRTIIEHEADQLRNTPFAERNNVLGLNNKILSNLGIEKVEGLDVPTVDGKPSSGGISYKDWDPGKSKDDAVRAMTQSTTPKEAALLRGGGGTIFPDGTMDTGDNLASSQVTEKKSKPNPDSDGKPSNKAKWAKRGFIGVGMATLTAAGLAVNSLMINDKGRMNNAQMYGQQPYSQY